MRQESSARLIFMGGVGEIGRNMACLELEGRILVYGMLSGRPCQIDTDTLVFRRLRIDGFTMYGWLEHTSLLGKLRTLAVAQRRLADDRRPGQHRR